jgi:hypothetical protein
LLGVGGLGVFGVSGVDILVLLETNGLALQSLYHAKVEKESGK